MLATIETSTPVFLPPAGSHEFKVSFMIDEIKVTICFLFCFNFLVEVAAILLLVSFASWGEEFSIPTCGWKVTRLQGQNRSEFLRVSPNHPNLHNHSNDQLSFWIDLKLKSCLLMGVFIFILQRFKQ